MKCLSEREVVGGVAAVEAGARSRSRGELAAAERLRSRLRRALRSIWLLRRILLLGSVGLLLGITLLWSIGLLGVALLHSARLVGTRSIAVHVGIPSLIEFAALHVYGESI